jgi:hypothetical protein
VKTIPTDEVFRTGVSSNRYNLMHLDVELLHRQERFTSCTVLMMCFVDALASPDSDSDRSRFAQFVKAHFAELYKGLDGLVPGKTGGDLLYDRYRNGLLHRLGPKAGFALCRNAELDGAFVGEIEIEGMGRFTAINVDRLVDEFLSLIRRLENEAA